jgi:hypothetical protein
MSRTFVKFLVVPLLLLVYCISAAFGMEPVVVATVSQLGEVIVVEVIADVPVALGTAWDVLTDFEHMAAFIGNVTLSKVIRREGNKVVVHQEGVARYGLLSLSFESEREIRMEPMIRIQTKSLSGSVKRMESESKLSQNESGTQIRYRAEVEPDSQLAKMFGASFIRHEVEEQFLEMSKEMIRRQGQVRPPVTRR